MLRTESAQDNAMVRQVAKSDRGRDFLKWMQDHADELAHRSLHGDGPDMYRVQGASLVLTEIVSLMRAAARNQ